MKIIHLSDPEHGWIEITFGEESVSHILTASDVPNDGLRELAAATSLLLAGSMDETVEFSLEPDFATCRLRREGQAVRVVVSLPDQAEPVFDATFPLHAFARRLRFELLRIEPCYSVPHAWTHPFPHREVANLA